jgi:hypothetical protein
LADTVYGGVTTVRVAGRFVAFGVFYQDRSSGNQPLSSVEVWDLKRRKRFHVHDIDVAPVLDPSLADLELRATGSAAYIVTAENYSPHVWRLAKTPKLLDEASDTDPWSLRREGDTVYWTSGSRERHARLP